MAGEVREAILEEIQMEGPISFARYMELALYAPGGYYERAPIGPNRDFVTSPHVHPVFGELLATGVRELYVASGSPTPFAIAEVGSGDGTLARSLIGALADLPVEYLAVETGAEAKAELSQIGGIRVAGDLEGEPQLILCHELLDNLPFRRLRSTEEGVKEILVGSEGTRLVEILAEPVDALVGGAAIDLQPGEEATWPAGALAFIDELAAHLTRGYALLIDYGADGFPAGEPHGYREQSVVEDLLADPGSTDITAGIDFSLISARASERGLTAFPTITQREALSALGFDDWMRAELGRQTQLLDERDGAGALRAWSGRSEATLLVDPTALGRHRWLLLASAGLPSLSFMGSPG